MALDTRATTKSAYPFTEGYVTVHGFQIHYVKIGAGEPVLFIHGNPTYSYLWRNIMPAVAHRHQAIALDLLGFGQSDKPGHVEYDFRVHADIIQGFIEQLQLAPLSLVLHDWGGLLGMSYVVNHPEQVRRLVLISTFVSPGFALPVLVRLAFRVLQLPPLSTLLIQRLNLLIWGAFTFGVRARGPAKRALRRAYLEPFPTHGSRKAVRRFPQMVPLSPKSESYRHLAQIGAALPTLDIPTLILKGETDPILTMARAHHLQQLLPHSRLQVIEGAGHFVQEDRPQAVAEAVRTFLET